MYFGVKKIYTKKNLAIFFAFIILSLFFLLRPQWEFGGDSNGYYIYLRSLYFDHDLKFDNELARYDGIYGTNYSQAAITPIGKSGNPFAVGMSVVWMPFFFIARIADLALNSDFNIMPGYEGVYPFLLSLGSIFYSIIGSIFLFCGLRKIFSEQASWFAVIAIVFLSSLPHYLIYEPLMSHAVSLAANCVLFWFSIKLYRSNAISRKDLVILGVLCGLAILLRWQEVIALLVPAGILIQKYFKNEIKIWEFFIPITAAILLFIPQVLVWQYLYGSFLLVPQGQNFIQFSQLKIFEILFSGMHGLFSWHPLLIFGVLGIVLSYKKDSLLAYLLFGVFALQVLVNSSLTDWWGGSAFGARKMISTLFVFSYGFAFLFDLFYSKKIIYYGFIFLLLFGSFWNFVLMVSVPKGYLSLSGYISIGELYSSPLKLIFEKIK